jgi:predicted LPLAT superfamily acyltransferase
VNCCVIVPVYNHGTPLSATIARLAEHRLPIFVVDDGSDAATKEAIAAIDARYDVQVISLPRNRGKGAAVMAGLRSAAAAGHTHALQVDADGQHDLDDVPKLLTAAREHPDSLICGAPRYDASAPKSRLVGRKLTSFWVRIETLSRTMPDTMCGFRVYPLATCVALLDSTRLGTRMDFDIEIAVRLNWDDVPLVAVPTTVTYPAGGTSNFRLVRDNWLITKLHTRLVLGMLIRWPMLLRKRLSRGLHWADLGERGGVLGMQTLLTIYRLFGRRAFTLFLYPVVAYFWLTAGNARRASKDFLNAVRSRAKELGLPEPSANSFGHVLEFGHAVLDKGAIWGGAFPASNVEFEDPVSFPQLRLRGCLFIGSHLGNLEVLRAFGDFRSFKVNALVFTRHSPKFNRVLSTVNEKAFDGMIEIDSLGPDTVMKLQDRIRAGEHIAIVGDRVSVRHKERSIHAPFLGRPAPFPEGPFILASLLDCPVYLLFCLKVGGKYRVFLEPFADPLELPRADRRAALEQVIRRYAERLEAYCLMTPTQWFNFFDFWEQADARRST